MNKLRGKCKEMSEQLVKADSSLTLVRGHYICPIDGKQAHWRAKTHDGTIIDPTKEQFPSKNGEYIEFDGNVECSQCGKAVREEDAVFHGADCGFCSGECLSVFLGLRKRCMNVNLQYVDARTTKTCFWTDL